jgi:hypothetical protein
MPSFIVDFLFYFVLSFFLFFVEVSLLAEVRFGALLRAPKRTPVANDAPALFSPHFCFVSTTTKPQSSKVIMSRV